MDVLKSSDDLHMQHALSGVTDSIHVQLFNRSAATCNTSHKYTDDVVNMEVKNIRIKIKSSSTVPQRFV